MSETTKFLILLGLAMLVGVTVANPLADRLGFPLAVLILAVACIGGAIWVTGG